MATIKTPYVVENGALIAMIVVRLRIIGTCTSVPFRDGGAAVVRFSSGFLGDTSAKCPIACAEDCHIIAVLWQEFVRPQGLSCPVVVRVCYVRMTFWGAFLWFSRVFTRWVLH